MYLHEGSLFWPTTMPRAQYTSPARIEPVYDVVIVGAGMSGILCAHVLQQHGYAVALIEQHEPVRNSTAANTGLLQYSNDIMLHELAQQIGLEQAIVFYKRCVQAIDELADIASSLHSDTQFVRRPSVCFASSSSDVMKLQREYRMLDEFGFPCAYWNERKLQATMGFQKAGALVTFNDAEVNPYQFARRLLDHVILNGGHVFPHTRVTTVHHGDIVHIETTNETFAARHIIYTTGYYDPPTGTIAAADIRRSYAVVTNRVDTLWHERALIWETARPYLYMRSTVDNRLVIGGLDEHFAKPTSNMQKITQHAEQLLQQAQQLFPHYTLTADYMYCASFGESTDHLPVIGRHPRYDNEFYLAGYGGNGTVYSMIGACELLAQLRNETTAITPIVQATRKNGVRTI